MPADHRGPGRLRVCPAAGAGEQNQQSAQGGSAVLDQFGRNLTQAARDNPYGQSKRAAEDALFALQRTHGVPVHVFRLPNVFGKWCRPNYNSAVATFCHHIARDLPITVNDPAAPVTLAIGERRFVLTGNDRAVWSPDAATDRAIVAAVRRIDGVYGDRNLVCSCPPIEAYSS